MRKKDYYVHILTGGFFGEQVRIWENDFDQPDHEVKVTREFRYKLRTDRYIDTYVLAGKGTDKDASAPFISYTFLERKSQNRQIRR